MAFCQEPLKGSSDDADYEVRPPEYTLSPEPTRLTVAIAAGASAIVGALLYDSSEHRYYVRNDHRYHVKRMKRDIIADIFTA